jgi:hypothetical protein
VEHLDPWYEAKSDWRSDMRCSTCYHQSEISGTAMVPSLFARSKRNILGSLAAQLLNDI